jgi:hypothetical protein
MKTTRQQIASGFRIAAVVVGIAVAAPLVANELVTKVNPQTGGHSDLLGREIESEGRYHRSLKNPWTRLYDWAYYLAGIGLVAALWHVGDRIDKTPPVDRPVGRASPRADSAASPSQRAQVSAELAALPGASEDLRTINPPPSTLN